MDSHAPPPATRAHVTRGRAKLADFSPQAALAGTLASFVGFASTFAVILKGLEAVGATQAQAASGLMAVSLAMGVAGVAISLLTRMPISVAWSTPGAALLVTAGVPSQGFPAAVGAFIVAGVLIVVAGLWRPLGRLVAAIPMPLANAMLAGILLNLCLAPVHAIGATPVQGLIVVAVWALVGRVRRLLAVPAAVLAAAILIAITRHGGPLPAGALWPHPVFVPPVWSPTTLLGLAVPLFIVTMASQNIPGLMVLSVNGYRPAAGPLFRATGLLSVLVAPFGGVAVNLAAITAALCAGEDSHDDPARRYWAGVVSGLVYIVFGLLAGAVAALVSASSPVLVEAVAGLALFGAFGGAITSAMSAPTGREAAVVTFLTTASGLTFLGIGGAFWGLLAGGAMLALTRWRGLGGVRSPRA